MSVVTHIETLKRRHQKLKDVISDAYSHHESDTEIQELKKEKLRLKEEISRLENDQEAA